MSTATIQTQNTAALPPAAATAEKAAPVAPVSAHKPAPESAGVATTADQPVQAVPEVHAHLATAEKAAPVAPVPAPKPVPESASVDAVADPLAHASPEAQAAAAAVTSDMLARAASAPESKPALQTAPVSSAANAPALDDIKRSEFLMHAASTMRDYASMGNTEADAVQHLVQMQQAQVIALNPQGTLAEVCGKALNEALNRQFTDVHCDIPLAESERVMRATLTKLQAQASAALALISEKAFIEEASKLAASDQALAAPPWYNDAKKAELLTQLTSDSPAHTLSNFMGHHFQHKALASIYKLDGPIQAALAQALRAAAPAACPEALMGQAKHLLHGCYHHAETIAAETKPGAGALYIEAMKRTEAKANATAPSTAAAVVTPPAPTHHEAAVPAAAALETAKSVVTAPATTQGIVAAPPLALATTPAV